MKIAVIALGKIGLPLAAQFVDMGHEVVGVDVQQTVVDKVNTETEPFPGEAHLQEKLSMLVPAGKLRATCDYSETIPGVDAIVIVVPLFINDETWQPNFGWMEAATRPFTEHFTLGTLISYETTLPAGTTRNRWKPMIEEVSGLEEGRDFHLVFSPERVLTGWVFEDLRKYPKLIGGLSPKGTAKGIDSYEQVLTFDECPDLPQGNGVWDVGSAEATEMIKLAETICRDVNIGLANQFGKFVAAHGIDVHKVIDVSNSQPYGHIHRPGIAVGGHCTPVYLRLYFYADPETTTVRTAREANMTMPGYAIGLAESVLGDLKGRRVVILGASYRDRVKETAFSGVSPTIEVLKSKGVGVLVHDPIYTDEELAAFGFTPYRLGKPVDATILQVDHPEYLDLTPTGLPGTQAIIDGRGVLDPAHWKGVAYRSIGGGTTRRAGSVTSRPSTMSTTLASPTRSAPP